MNIFVDERQGTPITEEERVWIEGEIRSLEEYLLNEEALEADARDCRESGLTTFDRDVIVMCVDADIAGMQRTLRTGYVICW